MVLSIDEHWNRDLRASPFRLRFELNAGSSALSMFACAYDRPRALARAALGSSDPIVIMAGQPNAGSAA